MTEFTCKNFESFFRLRFHTGPCCSHVAAPGAHMRRATCPSRLRAQRHQCASRPGFDETAQLNATGQLAIACKIVGASVARATTKAMQCALASADLRDGPSGAVAQWLDWGWARYSSDNGGCDSVAAFRAARTARTRTRSCLRRGDRFERMLNTTDVVIVAYNPQASGHARVTLLCSSAHAL